MNSVADIRVANLERLVEELGTLEAVAAAAKTSSVYLSAIRHRKPDPKNGRPRSMGDVVARKIEEGCKKPHGWMDHEPADWEVRNRAGELMRIEAKTQTDGGSAAAAPAAGLDKEEFRRTYNRLAEMVSTVPDDRRSEVANLLNMWIKTGKESFLDVLFTYFEEFEKSAKKH
jgi:hypothetical protein